MVINKGERAMRRNINWTQTMLNLLGTATDKELGKKWGIKKDTVRKKRERLGIPRYTRITHETIALWENTDLKSEN